MSKKQYLIMLLGIFFLNTTIKVIGSELIKKFIYAAFLACLSNIPAAILFGGVALLGIHFSQKVGLRLLFLDGQFDFINDIVKPAVWSGGLYACIVLTIVILLQMPFQANSYNVVDRMFSIAYHVIMYDVSVLLFCFSGFVLLLKTIGYFLPISVVMSASVFLTALFCNVGHAWLLKLAMNSADVIALIQNFTSNMLVGTLFWRRGFEAAVLCHIIIFIILCVIVPVFAFGKY